MSSRSISRSRGVSWALVKWVFVLGAIAAITWAIVFASMNHQRGIYAGYSYNDAAGVVRDAMTARYGRTFASHVRYAQPPVVNTHLNKALAGRGQVRVFHLVGPRGVRYCVQVWGSHTGQWVGKIEIGGKYVIQKGCRF